MGFPQSEGLEKTKIHQGNKQKNNQICANNSFHSQIVRFYHAQELESSVHETTDIRFLETGCHK